MITITENAMILVVAVGLVAGFGTVGYLITAGIEALLKYYGLIRQYSVKISADQLTVYPSICPHCSKKLGGDK